MKIFSVKFKGSSKTINVFIHNFPEYAFVGRSNVGKSSLINWITGRKKIAKVSSYPGRTQYINHFLINNQWYLIDLPGYGFFAEKKIKEKAQKLISDYIFHRKNLVGLFLLIDSRFLIQQIDLDFIQKLNNKKMDFCIVFTKTDKLNYKLIEKNISFCIEKIENNGFTMPVWFKVSAKKKDGRNNIIQYIKKLNDFYKSCKQKLIIPNS
ncbi:GTP-binding protein [Blattabacterium sp. (Blattella germanica) str. Bge]|uniref:ribosome biogenesis GTP-binding protein YihA/YsxC n=1 Tax=Blattabacterium sp. (Blattella germanica) TaxID=624186 RepID=UPI0001BB62F3|nr:ribosome biogenesis GTP-binding protein YihA/YsxC [Blattabacterium sp. (Blattella germanica)]ACY40115.1 GTP-binding protein [Blattabacterium sp. (Blattella germanica) str. Bge]